MVPRVRAKKPHNALKHGGYSVMGLLPGESPVQFGKLRKNLIDEFATQGPLEEDIVSTIARLLWRKQNLATFRTAESARERRNQIIAEEIARRKYWNQFPDFRRSRQMNPKMRRCRRPERTQYGRPRNKHGTSSENIMN
jgi:hypothetical protein